MRGQHKKHSKAENKKTKREIEAFQLLSIQADSAANSGCQYVKVDSKGEGGSVEGTSLTCRKFFHAAE